MALSKEKIKKLHAIAARNGLIVSGDRSDLLALVHGQTGKEHVSDLTDKEYGAVYARILTLGKKDVPGMMSSKQVGKAWALMHQLCEIDPCENTDAKARMAGVMKAALGIDVPRVGDIFRWVPEKTGWKLIETLKRYVATEERKQERKSG